MLEKGGSSSYAARPATAPLFRITPWAVSITASSFESFPVEEATYSRLPSGESAKSGFALVRMLPITLPVWESISQMRPAASPGLGSSTYSQPGCGWLQCST
jgi:hypothetical protein